MSRFVDEGGSRIIRPIPTGEPKTDVKQEDLDTDVQGDVYIISAFGKVPEGLGKGQAPRGWKKINIPPPKSIEDRIDAAKPEALIQKDDGIFVEYYNIVMGPAVGATTAFARYIYFKEGVDREKLKSIVSAYVT